MLLRTRITIAALSGALMVAVVVGGAGRFSLSLFEEQTVERSLRYQEVLWKKIAASTADGMEANFSGLTRNRDLQKAVRKGDAAAVTEAAQTTFNRLNMGKILDRLEVTDLNGNILFSSSNSRGKTGKQVVFTAAKETKIAKGIVVDDDNAIVVATAFPLFYRGKPIGVGVYGRTIQSTLDDYKANSGSDIFAFREDGSVAYSTLEAIPDEVEAAVPGFADRAEVTVTVGAMAYSVSSQPIIGFTGEQLARMVTMTDTTEAYNKKRTFDLSSYAFVGGMILVVGFGVFFLLRANFLPLRRVIDVLQALSEGNTDVDVPETTRQDEIGDLTSVVQVFMMNCNEINRMEEERKKERETAEVERREARAALADEFEANVGGIVHGVSTAATQMHSSASGMAENAEDTNLRATTVATAAEQASVNVQTVASAAEELSASSAEIARQVTKSATISGRAVDQAGITSEKISGLAEAADKIDEVVALITDIAEQTNLLALNATIEAARAGEAGKGFAVVASEVKNLANQTATATDNISAQVAAIQAATRDAVSAIVEIASTIEEVSAVTGNIAAAAEQQTAATEEIARNIEQASAGTGEVSSNIAGVTEAAGETGEAAGQLLNSATDLSKQASDLSAAVETFVNQIRG